MVLTGDKAVEQLGLPHGILPVKEHCAEFPTTANEIMMWLWQHWLKRWITDEEMTVLNVYLEQTYQELPTKRWKECADLLNNDFEKAKAPFRVSVKEARSKVERQAGNTPVSPAEALKALRKSSSANMQPPDSWLLEAGRHIVFDRHGTIASTINFNLPKDAYFLLDKSSSDFIDVFQPSFPKSELETWWTFPMELIEAGLLRVLIIDERIAERAHEEFVGDELKIKRLLGATNNPTKWHFARAAKVYICTHFGINKAPSPLHAAVEGKSPSLGVRFDYQEDLTIKNVTLGTISNVALGPVDEQASKHEEKIDMVIIHQGILDGLKDEVNLDAFLKALQQRIPFVIVDSGRGIPPTLSEKVKFLPFSVLQDYLLGQRIAKYRLTQVSMALTRKGGEARRSG
jgi:hypothetical protein